MKKLIKEGRCGTLQSNDCLIEVRPGSGKFELESPVKYEFEKQIHQVVDETLEKNEIDKNSVDVFIEDKGALDCTIEARLNTAIRRAHEED